MGEMADYYEAQGWSDDFEDDQPVRLKHKPRTKAQIKHPHARYGGSAALAKFAENLGPWLSLVSIKEFGDVVQAKFETTSDKLKIAGDIKALFIQCRGLPTDIHIYNGQKTNERWVSVRMFKDKDQQASAIRASSRSRHDGHYLNDHQMDMDVRQKIKDFDRRTTHALQPIKVAGRKKNAIVVHYMWNGNDLSPMIEYEDCGVIALQHFVEGTHGAQRVAVVFLDTTQQPSKKVKKMDEDHEFYLALLQSSGVKMVEVTLDKRPYNYLCALDVTEGQQVVIQARDQLMVGTVTDVLAEWNMDVVDQFGGDLKWVISVVDISNVVVYENQRKEVFAKLRQSRLMEKAKKFAGASNLDFNSLVAQTQDKLAIAHDDGVVGE